MTATPPFVIVGASLAGAKAAETLRLEGYDGPLVLVGEEPHRPYERPPLSKEFARGETGEEKLFVHPEGFYADHGIELRTSTRATGLDPATRELELDGGERLAYERLLITTGAEARRLAVPGAELDGVLYLRSLDDAAAIRDRIDRGGKVVVVGAGWIGAEIGASARGKGLEVTIVEQGAVPLERVLGPEVGAIYRDIHLDQGVDLVTGAALEGFEGDGRVERVKLSEGRRIGCDFVVVGIGVTPRTELADRAGLSVQNGIAVDERLETSVPGVFAAGDVANARHPLFGRLRVEHWANALNQGPAAALGMLGKGAPYDRVPYFFSDQYDVGMEYSGYADGSTPVVFRGDPASREFVAFWVDQGHVAAAMNVNVWGVTEAIQALVRSRVPVDPEQLADTSVPLEDIGTERPTAAKPVEGARKLMSEGLGFPKRFVEGRLAKGEATPVSQLAPGQAKVLQIDGEKVAVHRDDEGRLHAVSPVCTHMGCLVEWEGSGRSWYCACHGSRFAPDGSVLQGPAKKPLAAKHVEDGRAA